MPAAVASNVFFPNAQPESNVFFTNAQPDVQSVTYRKKHRQIEKEVDANQGLGVFKTTTEFLGTMGGIKVVLKLVNYTGKWWGFAGPVPTYVDAAGRLAGDVKNGVATVAELPIKSIEAVEKTINLFQKRDAISVKEFISASTEVMGPVSDAVSLLSSKNIINLSKETVSAVGTASSACLAVGTGIAATEQVYGMVGAYADIQNSTSEREKTSLAHKIALLAINFFKFASYVLLGTVGIVAATGVAIVAWVPLAFATSALFFTIFGYYYGKMNGVSAR